LRIGVSVCPQIGTYQIAMVAKALNRPLYVAVESYKFIRLFPLQQTDVPNRSLLLTDAPSGAEAIATPSCDYTSPDFITLLFTDLGILTPAAISDELIKLYY
jgi:translation initiation factor eIF-2B subunit alpha